MTLTRSSGMRDVVGLDIEPGFVAAVQASVNGVVRVQHAVGLPLDVDVVREGEVQDIEGLAEALREVFRDSKLSRNVRIGLANQRTVLRTLELPPIEDSKEMAAAVRFQAEDEVPMPLNSAVLDFQPLGLVDSPNGPRQRVALVAAQRDMVEKLLEAARQAGLRPMGVDLAAFAMIRSLYRPSATPERLVYLAVGGLSNMAIADGPVCRFTRMLGGGLEAMAIEVASRREVPLAEARALLPQVGLDEDEGPGDYDYYEDQRAYPRSEVYAEAPVDGPHGSYGTDADQGVPPTSDYQQPVYEQPVYEHEQPVYEQPAYEHEQPVYEQPVYEHEQPVYEPPAYEHEQPAYEQPAYEHEQPAYELAPGHDLGADHHTSIDYAVEPGATAALHDETATTPGYAADGPPAEQVGGEVPGLGRPNLPVDPSAPIASDALAAFPPPAYAPTADSAPHGYAPTAAGGSPEFPPPQAPAARVEVGHLRAALGADYEDIRSILLSGVRDLAGEVRNSLDYARAQEGGESVAAIVLCGAALEVPGFAAALERELGLPVRASTVGAVSDASYGLVSAQRLAVASGLAIVEVPA